MRRLLAGLAVGLTAAAVVLTAAAYFARAADTGKSPFDTIELATYDWRMRHTARPELARKDIALVLIDETSVRRLENIAGRWPWPRVVHSTVIDFLARAPARLIAYDINFAGPDLRDRFDYGATYSGEQSDNELAKSVKAAGNVIVLADATYANELPAALPVPDLGYLLDVPGVYEARSVLLPYNALAAAAAGIGHNLLSLDADSGAVRHVVPFVRNGHHAVPYLGVAAALRAAGIQPNDVRLDGDILRLGDRAMPLSGRRVTTSDGFVSYLWALIDFHGPAAGWDLKTDLYPTYSFVDLLESEMLIGDHQSPKVDPTVFKDKIVFVGASAAGTFDAFETPFAHGAMPGINVHAAVTDDILSNRFLAEAPRWTRLTGVLAIALIIGVVSTIVPAWWATAAALMIMAAGAWFATAQFARGAWYNLSQPVLAGSLALFGGVAYQYFVEGREKRMMKKLFGQYVSKDVYDQLVADPARARLGGTRREMTVLFSDIRGFTSFSESGQPEAIVDTLNEYFTRMVDIVFRHRGTLDKFVGDMVMALFGAPLDDPNHADHAVEAALDMIDELRRLNDRWKAEGRPDLDIGIGINTGPMIAGNIGSEAIMSYTVIGDAVNLGSRLESLNKTYGTRIIISEATKARLTGRYEYRALGDVVVKGKTKPVAIFEVVGRLRAAKEGLP